MRSNSSHENQVPDEIKMFTHDAPLTDLESYQQSALSTIAKALAQKQKDLEKVRSKRIQALDDIITTKQSRSNSH